MPKHYIYPNPNPDGTNARSRLELQWQRDGGVQLATTSYAGEGKPDTAITYLTEAGDQLPAMITGNTFTAAPLAWPGEHVELTRDQLNHLIKQLRIARDQAYGKDE